MNVEEAAKGWFDHFGPLASKILHERLMHREVVRRARAGGLKVFDRRGPTLGIVEERRGRADGVDGGRFRRQDLAPQGQ